MYLDKEKTPRIAEVVGDELDVINALDPIEELYDLYSDEEETLWITEIVDDGSEMGDGLADCHVPVDGGDKSIISNSDVSFYQKQG